MCHEDAVVLKEKGGKRRRMQRVFCFNRHWLAAWVLNLCCICALSMGACKPLASALEACHIRLLVLHAGLCLLPLQFKPTSISSWEEELRAVAAVPPWPDKEPRATAAPRLDLPATNRPGDPHQDDGHGVIVACHIRGDYADLSATNKLKTVAPRWANHAVLLMRGAATRCNLRCRFAPAICHPLVSCTWASCLHAAHGGTHTRKKVPMHTPGSQSSQMGILPDVPCGSAGVQIRSTDQSQSRAVRPHG